MLCSREVNGYDVRFLVQWTLCPLPNPKCPHEKVNHCHSRNSILLAMADHFCCSGRRWRRCLCPNKTPSISCDNKKYIPHIIHGMRLISRQMMLLFSSWNSAEAKLNFLYSQQATLAAAAGDAAGSRPIGSQVFLILTNQRAGCPAYWERALPRWPLQPPWSHVTTIESKHLDH